MHANRVRRRHLGKRSQAGQRCGQTMSQEEGGEVIAGEIDGSDG